MNKQTNDQPLLSTIGENYYYLKTIISNTIELKKLEILSSGSKVVSQLILWILMGFIIFLLSQVLLLLAAFVIYSYIGSWISTLSILSLVIIVCLAMIFFIGRIAINRIVEDKVISMIHTDGSN